MSKPGNPLLADYIVSTRYANSNWPASDAKALADARRKHDEGLVTMCQGRAGHLIIQYAIPTLRPVKRTPYFNQRDYAC